MAVRPHGTRAKYVAEKCHCRECRRANTTYQTKWEKRKAYEKFGAIAPALMPADESRDHLHFLRSHGVGLRQVCKVTGLSRSSLDKLSKGRLKHVTSRTHELVGGVCLDDKAAGRWPS